MLCFFKNNSCLPLQNLVDEGESFSQNQNGFNIIPNEVLLNVFKFLSPEELNNVSLVDRRWNSIADDNLLWKGVFENIFGDEKPEDGLDWKTHYVNQCKKVGKIIQSNKFKNEKQPSSDTKIPLTYVYFDDQNNVKGIGKKIKNMGPIKIALSLKASRIPQAQQMAGKRIMSLQNYMLKQGGIHGNMILI